MEIKKSPKADLEKQRVIFIEIGLVLALSLILFAFEWTSSKGSAGDLGQLSNVDSEEEIIPITRQEEVKPPPPPPPPQVTEVLNIVEDDVEIEEELEMEETEADEETEVEIIEVADEEEEAEIFHIVEDMPQFPGGDIELRKYIATKVVYPQIARETGIEGKVYVSFVVNSKGAVTKVQLVRGVDPLLDKEALKVIEGLPKWTPGKQRGKPVNVSFTVPITFKLG
jgi:protein TonB